jgi:hypothetical protein
MICTLPQRLVGSDRFKAVAVPCKMPILSWCIGADGSGKVVEESEKQKTGRGRKSRDGRRMETIVM